MTKMEAGIVLGYDHIGVKQWNKSINSYNALTQSSQKTISKGITYGVFFAYRLKKGLTLVPEISFSNFNSKTADLSIKNKSTNFRLSAKVYPFYFLSPRYFTRFKKNFFVQATPSYGLFSNETVLKINPTPVETNGKGNLITLGLGVGYDAFISEKVSITPTFQVYFNPKAEIPEFAEVLHGVAPVDGLKNKNALWDIQLGVRLGYVLKPTLPLCPIQKCNVRMEHTHSGIGSLVRGSRLAFKQNRRIGEKYKDVRVIRWMKTINEFLKKKFPKKEKKEAEEIENTTETVTPSGDAASDETPTDDPFSDDNSNGDNDGSDDTGGDDGDDGN